MDPISGRRFLIASGVTGGAALLAGAAGFLLSQLHDKAVSAPLAAGTPILVVLTMYGGNDGLNTVIPYADSAYKDARPEPGLRRGRGAPPRRRPRAEPSD